MLPMLAGFEGGAELVADEGEVVVGVGVVGVDADRDAEMAPGRVARWYEMHLLDELGQRPEVDRCVECDRVLEADERFRWVPPLGGILCERCPGPPHDRAGISLDAVKLLKAYLGYLLGDGQKLLPSLNYAPLPSNLDSMATAQLSQITS